jgi:hypothetical protein
MSVKDTAEYKEVAELLGKYEKRFETYHYEITCNTKKEEREVFPFKYRCVSSVCKKIKWRRATIGVAKDLIEGWIRYDFTGTELESVKRAEHELAKAQARRERAEARAHNVRLMMAARREEKAAFDFMNWLGRNGQNKKDAPVAWGILEER